MMTPLPPDFPMQVTLEAQQWNQLIGMLHEVAMPMRITAPLVKRITDQLDLIQNARQAAIDAKEVKPIAPNGAAEPPNFPAEP